VAELVPAAVAAAELGGATAVAPPPVPFAAPTPATALEAPDAELPPPPAPGPRPLDASVPPPSNIPAPVPMPEPVARAALAIAPTVAARSPPVRVGAPPRTPAKSLGICQHSIMKITAAPITSKAVIKGRADALTLCASSIQFRPRFMPAAMRQYSRRILIDLADPALSAGTHRIDSGLVG